MKTAQIGSTRFGKGKITLPCRTTQKQFMTALLIRIQSDAVMLNFSFALKKRMIYIYKKIKQKQKQKTRQRRRAVESHSSAYRRTRPRARSSSMIPRAKSIGIASEMPSMPVPASLSDAMPITFLFCGGECGPFCPCSVERLADAADCL